MMKNDVEEAKLLFRATSEASFPRSRLPSNLVKFRCYFLANFWLLAALSIFMKEEIVKIVKKQ
jgi:hypothetical protein